MNRDSLVSVVVPLYNDADIVDGFVRELVDVLRRHYAHYEVVLVDDGSTDDIGAPVERLLASHEFLRFLRLSRHFGEEIAISAGLDSVIGDFVVVILPNSDPPALIPDFVERARRGADVVYGVRRNRDADRWWARWGARLFYWYAHRVMKVDLPKDSTQFRCMSRQAVNAITQIRDSNRYLRVFTAYIGFVKEPVVYDLVNRRGRPVGRGFLDSVNLAIAIVVDNSAHPLRLLTWLGVTAGVVNVLYAGYVIGIYLFKPRVAEGWVTLSMQSALQFFLISVILTALCEYTGRLVTAASDRPFYYIREERTSSVLLREERRNVVTDALTDSATQSAEGMPGAEHYAR